MPRRRAAQQEESEEEEEVQPTRSKKRGRKKNTQADSDEEAPTQGSAKKGKKGKEKAAPLSAEEIKTRGKDLARYALLNEFNRRPLRRDEATKLVIGAGQTRKFPAVLKAASAELAAVFGLELVEARPRGQNAGALAATEEAERDSRQERRRSQNDDEQPASTASKKSSAPAKSYIVRSVFPPETLAQAVAAIEYQREGGQPEEEEELDWEGNWAKDDNAVLDWKRHDELAQQGLLGIVLALILANGRVIDDQQLRSHLRRLGVGADWKPPITPASHNPPVNLDGLLGNFQKQGYLEKSRVGGGAATQATQSGRRRASGQVDTGDAATEWRWGARAEVEIGEQSIAELMAEIYLEGDPNAEANQEEPAQGGRRQRNQQQGPNAAERLIGDIKQAAGSALQDADKVESV